MTPIATADLINFKDKTILMKGDNFKGTRKVVIKKINLPFIFAYDKTNASYFETSTPENLKFYLPKQ